MDGQWSDTVSWEEALGAAPVLVKLEEGCLASEESLSFSKDDLIALEGSATVKGRKLVLAHYTTELEYEDGNCGQEAMYRALVTIPRHKLPDVEVRLRHDPQGHEYTNFLTDNFPQCNWRNQQKEVLDDMDEDDYDSIYEVVPTRVPSNLPTSASSTTSPSSTTSQQHRRPPPLPPSLHSRRPHASAAPPPPLPHPDKIPPRPPPLTGKGKGEKPGSGKDKPPPRPPRSSNSSLSSPSPSFLPSPSPSSLPSPSPSSLSSSSPFSFSSPVSAVSPPRCAKNSQDESVGLHFGFMPTFAELTVKTSPSEGPLFPIEKEQMKNKQLEQPQPDDDDNEYLEIIDDQEDYSEIREVEEMVKRGEAHLPPTTTTTTTTYNTYNTSKTCQPKTSTQPKTGEGRKVYTTDIKVTTIKPMAQVAPLRDVTTGTAIASPKSPTISHGTYADGRDTRKAISGPRPQPPTDLNKLRCRDLCTHLQRCGMKDLAKVCEIHKLDGNFISGLKDEELKKPPFALTDFKLMQFKRIQDGWIPKE